MVSVVAWAASPGSCSIRLPRDHPPFPVGHRGRGSRGVDVHLGSEVRVTGEGLPVSLAWEHGLPGAGPCEKWAKSLKVKNSRQSSPPSCALALLLCDPRWHPYTGLFSLCSHVA